MRRSKRRMGRKDGKTRGWRNKAGKGVECEGGSD
jgi:hypothetical protein